MNAQCSHCSAEIEAGWKFCPHCGEAAPHAAHVTPEEERHPARGAFGGLLYGLIAAPILIIAGVMICLTGWGIFLGIPVIVMGVVAPLAGPLFGMSEHAARCPQCGMKIVTVADGQVHACPACSGQFAIGPHGVVGAR